MQPEDLVKALELYRPGLRLLAGARMDPRLRKMVDPSDLVQESLVKAYAHLSQFQGHTPEQLYGWVRRILANEMALAIRRYLGGPRHLERSLEACLEESSLHLERWLADLSSEPMALAAQRELGARLVTALASLPEDQRTTLELRYLQGMSPPEIAKLQGKTTAAVAGLLRRGLETIRVVLLEES